MLADELTKIVVLLRELGEEDPIGVLVKVFTNLRVCLEKEVKNNPNRVLEFRPYVEIVIGPEEPR